MYCCLISWIQPHNLRIYPIKIKMLKIHPYKFTFLSNSIIILNNLARNLPNSFLSSNFKKIVSLISLASSSDDDKLKSQSHEWDILLNRIKLSKCARNSKSFNFKSLILSFEWFNSNPIWWNLTKIGNWMILVSTCLQP